ncbi:ATP-binding protein [Flagellimonas sp.]|uniref:hybrid sensor histidine kinase/response regulator transcription factor n=1 Tax=Flagellimonas sp. TaxID=2058762 RepID=UPI003BB10CD6
MKRKCGILLFAILLGGGTEVIGQDGGSFKSLVPTHNNKPLFVTSIAQDSLGNIWMSSSLGVLIYNGYSYSVIKRKSIFPQMGQDDRIRSISSDESKNIWITTSGGLLSKYNAGLGQFEGFKPKLGESVWEVKPNGKQVWIATKNGTLYKYHNKVLDSITTIPNINMADNMVNDLEFDKNDNVYVGTTKGKIHKYSIQSGRQTEIIGPFTDYPGGIVLEVDRKNRLWIGTEANGLHVYDIAKQRIISESFFTGDINDITSSLFLNLFLDSNDNIWGGTDGSGLYKVDSETGVVRVFKKRYFTASSIESNTILDINEDDHKNIWAVTKYGTLNVLPIANDKIRYHPGSENNIPMRVLCMLKTSDETLWIGTDGMGLTKIAADGTKEQFFNGPNNSFYVHSIVADEKSNLWLGTYRNGLWHHDLTSSTFKRVEVENSKGQTASDIRVLYRDSKKRLWVGSNVSLNIYTSDHRLLASFGNNENGLSGTIVESILEDKNGVVWLGQSGGGLFKFQENKEKLSLSSFKNFKTGPDDIIPRVFSLSNLSDSTLLMINEKRELLAFNTETEKYCNFEHFGTIKDLSFSAVTSVDQDNIWASTYNSILHLDLKGQTTEMYYSSDGLPDGSFMTSSVHNGKDGQLYFGSTTGVTYFYPHELIKKPSNPKLVVYDIQVLNKPAKDLLPNQIKSEVFNLSNLKLDYNQSSFSVRFSAIDNILNPNYFYTYKLVGFDSEWKKTYTEGLATYTNVPPGKYTLEIRVHEMNDLSKNFGKTIAISIAQPFWNKPLAHVIYITLFVLLAFGCVKWYRLRKKLLIHRIIRAKEQDLHNTKMDFFTKMSHEIQTPITLILGPIEDMLKRAELNGNMLLKERLNIISNNAKRLSRIARELTLLRNKETNKLSLLVSKNNLHSDINHICMSFKEIARNKQIDFSISCPKNLNNAWYDKEKIEHILYNLLSNAFKYTPTEGNVQLSVSPISKKSYIKISVSDSGQGIQKNELDKIFKLFYRSDSNKKARGTGIGLALTKELVTLHRGKIKVNSVANEGTTFTVKIPILEEFYVDQEKMALEDEGIAPKFQKQPQQPKNGPVNHKEKSILIVEDNFELQQFLKNLLSTQYNILLADNGEEGFYLAKNNIPDLIISDIMMPRMDGIQMCSELNKNNLTKHIPIVLLTAKNSTKAKIEGLKTGAVEFINKPFNTNELILKVNNLLLSKEHIISKYRKELINRPQVAENRSQDEIFLASFVDKINHNMDDPDFKIQQLAESLNMSYSSLYRKCLNITGLTVIDFIRRIRLNKAAILLTKFGYPISEVAHLVGFNDPKYFSKSFKNQFGKTPKEFKKASDLADDLESYLSEHKINNISLERTTY